MTLKQLLGGQVHTCETAGFSQPRPSSPGREPWVPNSDRGDNLVLSLAAVTKLTSKSDQRLEGFDVAHGMQPGMQEGLVEGRSMRWHLGSQLAFSCFTLSVCACVFVSLCTHVCEGSRIVFGSQSLILMWVSGIEFRSSALAASTLTH